MKKIILTTLGSCLLILCAVGILTGQSCPTNPIVKKFTTQRLSIQHSPTVRNWVSDNEATGLEVNDVLLADEPTQVAYSGSIWMSGTLANGELAIAASTFGPDASGNSGPLNDDGSVNEDWCNQFNKIWEIKGEELAIFLADLEDNGIIDMDVSTLILSWPGKNNPHSQEFNGFELPIDRDLAPFHDTDQDGNYDPLMGDYPSIKGAEIAQWWMYNTAFDGVTSLPIETSCLVYSYDTEAADNATVYYEFEMTNRSSETIKDMNFSIWVDPEIGCFNDDYVGCSVTDNMAYAYNGDGVDGENCSCPQGVRTFCNGLPLFGIKLLAGPENGLGQDRGMSSFIAYNNAGIGGPWPAGTTDPLTALEYENYMKGLWRDSSFTVNGENGYDPSSNDFASFLYPDAPDDPNGWSMCSEGLPATDLRFLMNTEKFDLSPGAKNGISYAAIVTGPVEHPCPDITSLLEAGKEAMEMYQSPPSAIIDYYIPGIPVQVMPNPATTFINISVDIFRIDRLRLLRTNGQLVQEIENIDRQEFKMGTADLDTGIYFLEVYTKYGDQGVAKVVIR